MNATEQILHLSQSLAILDNLKVDESDLMGTIADRIDALLDGTNPDDLLAKISSLEARMISLKKDIDLATKYISGELTKEEIQNHSLGVEIRILLKTHSDRLLPEDPS